MKKTIIVWLAISSILFGWCFGKKTTLNTEEYKTNTSAVVEESWSDAKQVAEWFVALIKECKIKDSMQQYVLSGDTYYQVLQKNAQNQDVDGECKKNMWTGVVYQLKEVVYNQNDESFATADITLQKWWKTSSMKIELKKVDGKWWIIDDSSKYGRQTKKLDQKATTWDVLTGN